MARTLRNLKIDEVSGVDKGAGRGVRVLLMKRDGDDDEQAQVTAATDALAKSICSILADDKVEDPAAEIAKSISQFSAHLAGLSPDTKENAMTPEEVKKVAEDAVKVALDAANKIAADELAKRDIEIAVLKMSEKQKSHYDKLDDAGKKKFRDMSDDDKDAACKKSDETEADPVAKRIEDATKPLIEKASVLEKRVAEFETKEQIAVFAKRAVEAGLTEKDGEIMRKAFSGDADAQAALIKRQGEVVRGLTEQVKTGKVFAEFGKSGPSAGATANDEMKSKAEELRKTADGSKLTEAQAYTKVYTDPANRELAGRVRDEQMRKINGVASA